MKLLSKTNYLSDSTANQKISFNHPSLLHVCSASIFSALLLAGCASKPIPTEQFAISKTAIDSATAAGADQYAPLEIKSAREKLTSAERSVNEKNYDVAAALAEEATVDAKLAEAKSESGKSKRSVEEIDKNLRTLMDESNRSQQLMQPSSNSQPR
jgi:hypothetical protein